MPSINRVPCRLSAAKVSGFLSSPQRRDQRRHARRMPLNVPPCITPPLANSSISSARPAKQETGKTLAIALPNRRQVRRNPKMGLRAPRRNPKTGDHLVKNQDSARIAARPPHALQKALSRKNRARVAHRRLHYHSGHIPSLEPPLQHLQLFTAAPSVCTPACKSCPALPGTAFGASSGPYSSGVGAMLHNILSIQPW